MAQLFHCSRVQLLPLGIPPEAAPQKALSQDCGTTMVGNRYWMPPPKQFEANVPCVQLQHTRQTANVWGHGGVFAQRGHSAGTAPITTVFILGTPLQTTPLQKRA